MLLLELIGARPHPGSDPGCGPFVCDGLTSSPVEDFPSRV
ncbi:Uncharacterised protein [Mycobacteroides abscessus subsp. abscessus]|nr:Uncharacterised protein [Mycobacteroides abscessus subsp. abscessus]